MWPHGTKTIARTKLVATLGPATASEERLESVLDAGVDVCRLNFSHGSLDDHARALRLVRDWEKRRGRPVAVLGDLGGPKIRLHEVEGGAFNIHLGDRIRFVAGGGPCTPDRLSVNYPTFLEEVSVGQRIYIDDGLVRLLVSDREPDALVCTCIFGGAISSRKGVNLPDSRLSTTALTDKDRRDLAWAMENGLDYVALSFVQRPADLDALLEIVRANDSDLGVVVKIEKTEALEHLDLLVAKADAVMVARGDLGVEMDIWQVPLVQKSLVARCREAGKPVIVATQMLHSMIHNPVPTRAEVSDVANAIFDAADAVMLSAETAAGEFPTAAVEVMNRTARASEEYQSELQRRQPQLPATIHMNHRTTSAIVQGAAHATRHLDARLVAAWSATGETVRLLARQRLPVPVVGLTYSERVFRRLNLLYGVVPVLVAPMSHPGEMADSLDRLLIERELAEPGDLIVVVTSTRPTTPGATDTTLVHRVQDPGR